MSERIFSWNDIFKWPLRGDSSYDKTYMCPSRIQHTQITMLSSPLFTLPQFDWLNVNRSQIKLIIKTRTCAVCTVHAWVFLFPGHEHHMLKSFIKIYSQRHRQDLSFYFAYTVYIYKKNYDMIQTQIVGTVWPRRSIILLCSTVCT